MSTFDALLAKYGPARLNEIDHLIHERTGTPSGYIEQLRLEVSSVEEYLHSLRARLNQFSPLLRIPPEILQEIVLFASALEPGGRAGNGGLGWMKLTHLCRAIRTSILQMRSVWAGVVFRFPGALEELAKRAGDVPLTLILDERFSASNQLISSDAFAFAYAKIFQAKLYRLREGSRSLSLGQWWMEVASSITGREFPFLEYLCIDVSPQRSANGDTMIYDAPPIITPRLRALYLENAWIPFSPTTLVSLALTRSYRPAEETLPSASLFLDILRQCTSLQELNIVQCIPQLPILTRESTTGAIQLPFLTVLDVWAPLTKILTFWSHLDVPKSAYLNMGCDCYIVRNDAALLDEGDEVIEPYLDPRRMDLIRSFGSHLSEKLDEPAIAGASFIERPDSMFMFELWTRSSDPQHSDKPFRPEVFKHKHSPRFGVAFDCWPRSSTPQDGGYMQALDVAWSCFSLQSITTLEIGAPVPYSAERWRDALSRFTQVETLVLQEVSDSFVLGAFATDVTSGTGLPILPNLQSLTIDLLVFIDLRDLSSQYPGVYMSIAELLGMLRYLSEHGSPVRHLVIKEFDPQGARPREVDAFFDGLDDLIPTRLIGVYIKECEEKDGTWRESDSAEDEPL